MNASVQNSVCPQCGGTLPAELEQGICPKCALAAVAAPTEGDLESAHRGPPPALEAVAAAFPQLEILELIGQGGMGAVYRARQPKLDRPVALKLLAAPAGGSGTFAERFHREARLLARLSHPGIVAVHDYGETGGFFYLVMEYVDGVNLREAMRAGRFTPDQALALVPKICEALQYAHDEGILHRDIKPENLLLDMRGRVKIADFGIAKLIGDKAKDAAITASGLAVGTPHYMAPEQLEHPQDVDQRADIYSLGVVFYEMLTGELPIGRFARPSQKTPLDPRVDEIVLRALEKERERRQSNVTQMKTEVEQITATPLRDAPAAAAEPKTSLCYVTTPEYLKTFFGRYFYIYQGNGQLRLDDRSLGFISGWQRVTIPLASVRALTLGEYSLAAKPVPLHYLEVTFLENSGSRTLLFTPTRSGILPVWDTNKVVAEWASAVQQAVQSATGRSIAVSRAKDVRGRSWGEALKTLELTIVLCSWPFLLIPILVEQRAPNRWTDYLPGPLIAIILLGGMHLLRWLMERRALRKGNLSDITACPIAYDMDDPIFVPAQTPTAGSPRSSNGLGPSETMVAPRKEALSVTEAGAKGRRAVCYFSTPERMRNCFPGPQAHILQCKGEVQLDAEQLVFVSPWQTRVVIPLKEIRGLSVGQFQMWTTPWVMKYGRFNFLSITFGDAGRERTVHLTPVPDGACSTEQANAAVAAWFEAIRATTAALTGATPAASAPAAVTFGAERPWSQKGGPISAGFLICCALFVWQLLRQTSPAVFALVAVAMVLPLLGMLWWCHGFLAADRAVKRGLFDKITSDEPPCPTVDKPSAQASPPPARPLRLSWMAVAALGCSLLAWWWALGLMFRLHASLGPDGLPLGGFTIGMMELIVGCAGLVGASLGARALQEIRRSAGQRLGARVAIAALLALPAGVLIKLGPPLVTALARNSDWRPTVEQGELLMGATLIGIFTLLMWATWRLRQWVQPEKCGPS